MKTTAVTMVQIASSLLLPCEYVALPGRLLPNWNTTYPSAHWARMNAIATTQSVCMNCASYAGPCSVIDGGNHHVGCQILWATNNNTLPITRSQRRMPRALPIRLLDQGLITINAKRAGRYKTDACSNRRACQVDRRVAARTLKYKNAIPSSNAPIT